MSWLALIFIEGNMGTDVDYNKQTNIDTRTITNFMRNNSIFDEIIHPDLSGPNMHDSVRRRAVFALSIALPLLCL